MPTFFSSVSCAPGTVDRVSRESASPYAPRLPVTLTYVNYDIQWKVSPKDKPLVRCHELRIQDQQEIWRIVYRIDGDAIVIVEVFKKKTQATPKRVIEQSQVRLRRYDQAAKED